MALVDDSYLILTFNNFCHVFDNFELLCFNRLRPNSDQHRYSPYHISASKHIQVIRI